MHESRALYRLAHPTSVFAGFRFPPEVITLAGRWYLRFGLSYRDWRSCSPSGVSTSICDRVPVGTAVHTAADQGSLTLPACSRRSVVRRRDVCRSRRTMDLYRAIDQFVQVIDVLASEKRDLATTRRFFTRALKHNHAQLEVSTDRAPAYPRVIEELLPSACHITE